MRPTSDLRVNHLRPLLPPAILKEELPCDGRTALLIQGHRQALSRIVHGRDVRPVVIVGPCSVHDPEAARSYAARLAPIAA